MTPHDGTPARRTTVVTDGDLPTRLLAFLEHRVTDDRATDDRATGGRATGGRVTEDRRTAAGRDLPAVDADLVQRLRAAHADALPGRLAAIGRAARAGDTRALAAGSTALAGSSGQLGDPAVARLSGAVAREARRGVVAHALVEELTGSPVTEPRDGQATSR